MERKKDTGKIWFRKKGRGSLRHEGKIIKPNQKFLAYPGNIPASFRDVVVPVDKDAEKYEQPKVESTEYKLESRGSGWFDIVNATTGKCMNEKALKRDAALKKISELTG